jgi:DNA topoisomerase III
MSVVVFLCEKPSQAGDIAKVLGVIRRHPSHYETREGIVTYAFGHLLELAEPESYDARMKDWRLDLLPFEVAQFRYVPKPATKGQLSEVKKLIKNASKVIIATDPDREGEMIGREILDYCGFHGPIERLWLNALDELSIRKALNNVRPGSETHSLAEAAKARSQADWLVGVNLTRATTKKWYPPNQKGFYSIGRVQTPTLAMVVRRDREIENFVTRDYFEVEASVLTESKAAVQLRHAPKDEKRIFDRRQADVIAAQAYGFTGPLTVEQEEKHQSPPKLFSLSLLQKKCSALYGWSADQTLNVAQALYERHKATTYPRTDCSYLPEEQIQQIDTIVGRLRRTIFKEFCFPEAWRPEIRKSVFNSAKVTAHHAIIPTTKEVDLSLMNPNERKVYQLICAHYLAMLFPDYQYLHTKVLLDVVGYEFCASGATPLRSGWKAVFKQDQIEQLQDQAQSETMLPKIMNGERGTVKATEVIACKTKPPARYTEGTLIEDMKSVGKFVSDPGLKAILKETSGIGTEATRATIIKTLRDRAFLETRGKTILSTSSGRALVCTLEENLPELIDPGQTALWEQKLEAIAADMAASSFMDGIRHQIGAYIEVVKEANGPKIASGVPVVMGEFSITDHGSFYTVDQYPGVRFAKRICQREIKQSELANVLRSEGVPVKFNGFVSPKSGKRFDAGLIFNPKGLEGRELEFVFQEKMETPNCSKMRP